MWIFYALCLVTIAIAVADDDCDVSKYVECVEPIHNATFGHPHGLFQNSNDLIETCPVIKNGISCIEKYAKKCGTDMIAEDYHEQYEKPAEFLTKICDTDSSLRQGYVKVSPCMKEHSEDLEICSTKVQEFLAFFTADASDNELTMTCMYEMMLRSCLMSTGADKCGMEAATFIRKALHYSPSLGMQTCSKM